MLCFSTTLLLAATFLLICAGASAETVTTCEGDVVHRLSCDIGVISVQTVLYGRHDTVTCSEGQPSEQISDTECSLANAADVLKRTCDGRTVCELSASVFAGSDPCSGTFKYLETKYDCLPSIHLVTCEHSLAHLHCDVGQFISVFSANYGRHDKTTCSYKRPDSQIENIDCSHPTSKVSDTCNGKNGCIVTVENSVFGEPCAGTYKYLEIAYMCEYPAGTTDIKDSLSVDLS